MSATLPTVEKPAPVAGRSLHPVFYIANWIFFSNLTILFNKWLIDTAGFKYPVILTCFHMVFAAVATQILARTTSLLDSRREVKMTGRTYLRAVVPIGIAYSGSLVCSNLVYLYLSVAFIQMLKAASPVAVLFTSWLWGVADPSMNTFLNILVIVLGVGLASFGEIQFSVIGFLYQLGGIVFEAVRVVMIQVLLSGDENAQKMDPLVSLYYYAPVCAFTNFIVAALVEIRSFDWQDVHKVGPWMLMLSASVAFLLNIASVFLIGKTSGLVMTLTGILKNILLIVAAVFIWGTSITSLQFIGYSIALGGLVVYSTGLSQLKDAAVNTFTWAKNAWNSPNLEEGRLSTRVKRALIMGFAALISVMLITGYIFSDSVNLNLGAISSGAVGHH